MKYLALQCIRFYQTLSRNGVTTPFFFGSFSGCRSWPTCSDFAYQEISQRGLVAGGMTALSRFLRCNPFSRRIHIS